MLNRCLGPLLTFLTDITANPVNIPETRGLKNYFHLLLAVVNNEDYKPLLEKVPEELKELFEGTEQGKTK